MKQIILKDKVINLSKEDEKFVNFKKESGNRVDEMFIESGWLNCNS